MIDQTFSIGFSSGEIAGQSLVLTLFCRFQFPFYVICCDFHSHYFFTTPNLFRQNQKTFSRLWQVLFVDNSHIFDYRCILYYYYCPSIILFLACLHSQPPNVALPILKCLKLPHIFAAAL